MVVHTQTNKHKLNAVLVVKIVVSLILWYYWYGDKLFDDFWCYFL